MNTELTSTEDNNLSKLIFVGFALASTGLFTASSIQTKKHGKALRYCHRERRKNAKFTTRTARRLIREVFPDSQNRNIAIHLHPFNASRLEIELGTVEGTRMLSEATRSKFIGHIYYWEEGVLPETGSCTRWGILRTITRGGYYTEIALPVNFRVSLTAKQLQCSGLV